jgi:Xaa-Pro dipeptidase
MYPHQAERLCDALDRAGLAALVGTSPANLAYIAGFRRQLERSFGSHQFAVFTPRATALVLPVADSPTIVAEGADADEVMQFDPVPMAGSPASDRRPRDSGSRETAGAVAALATALERLGVRHGPIGLDESWLTHSAWKRLVEGLPGIHVVAASHHLAAARRVKGPYEIECLGHALRISEEALDVVIQTIERNTTEREAATVFGVEVLKRGAWPRPPIVAVGQRAAIPAPTPTDAPLRPGALVRFDVGCLYKGYHASVARTAVLGEPTQQHETAYKALQASLEAATAEMTAGTSVGRVFLSAVDVVRASGLPEHAGTIVGHGIGLDPYEPPALGPDHEPLLELGEVVCLEVSFYDPGAAGLSARDTILVTSAGGRALNRSHHGLVVLD